MSAGSVTFVSPLPLDGPRPFPSVFRRRRVQAPAADVRDAVPGSAARGPVGGGSPERGRPTVDAPPGTRGGRLGADDGAPRPGARLPRLRLAAPAFPGRDGRTRRR